MSDAATVRRRAAAAYNSRRAAEAQAKAAAASAQAEAARAAAAQSQAALEMKRLDAAAEKRRFDRENSIGGRAWQAGVNVAMPLAGIATGYKMASTIEKRHVAATAVRNKQLAALAGGLTRTMAATPSGKAATAARTARLAASVATADRLALAASRGPYGIGMAGVLLAEGALARFVIAPQIKNETAREVVSGAGSLFGFAATTMIAKRVVANATPKAVPNAAHMATVETARRMPGVAAAAATQMPRAGVLARVASVAGKVALPAAVAAAGYAAYQGYRRAGVGGAALGAADSLTFGLATPIARMVGYTPQSSAAGRVALARAAAQRVQQGVERHRVRGARLRSIASAPRSDGMTQSYTRRQGGKTVHVQGYKTPTRRR